MKKALFLLVTLLCFITNISANFDNKVYDYANILNDKEEKKLNNKIKRYVERSKINLVVITVNHHEFDATHEYLTEYYDTNLDGDTIILGIDFKLDKIDIEAYGKPFKVYRNARIRSILNKLDKEETYYKKINVFIKQISSDYSIYTIDDLIKHIIISIILSFIIVSGLIWFKLHNKKEEKEEYVNYVDYDNIQIEKREDVFVTTHTHKNRSKKKRK